jgi:ribosome recycling factor
MVRKYGNNTRKKNCKGMFKYIPEGKWSIRKPRKKWLDDVEDHRKKMCATGWGKIAGKRDI